MFLCVWTSSRFNDDEDEGQQCVVFGVQEVISVCISAMMTTL